jgi:hypothetical protein
MGFVLTLFYVLAYYLTPAILFGSLARFRLQLILVLVIFIISLPRLARSFPARSSQSFAVVGLAIAVFLSILFGASWLGGAVQGFIAFVPNAMVYYFACIHFNSRRRLQGISFILLFVCVFVTAHGAMDLYRGVPEANPRQADLGDAGVQAWNEEHPYLFAMRNDAGQWFFRLRGLGPINDPNDFGQIEVCTIPLMFLFWRAKKRVRNILFVVLPVAVLLTGIFLTHSRGALLALTILAVIAAQRRIGTVPAVVVGAGLLLAAMALQFTGGRGISAEAGADRTVLWGEGLALLKGHPLFGVGFGRMAEHTQLTAHNSIVVCAAELGLFGLYFWSMFLFATVRDALKIIASQEGTAVTASSTYGARPVQQAKAEPISALETVRTGRLVLLSLTGFLLTSWFLSRAFVLTLFLLGGTVEAVYEMAHAKGLVPARLRLKQVLPKAGLLAVCLVLIMYVVVRLLNLAR